MENTKKHLALYSVVGQKWNYTLNRPEYETLQKFTSKATALRYASEMEEMLQQANPDVRCDVIESF